MTFGERLKKSRKAMNLTQKELANLINAKHNSISNWENNQNKPDPDTIELICGTLNITPNYLLGTNSSTDLSINEQEIIKKYRVIDNTGKKVVDTILDREYERATLPMLKAAHERTDIEVTDEMKQHDEDIMNDENF